jgi:hypothetical protein
MPSIDPARLRGRTIAFDAQEAYVAALICAGSAEALDALAKELTGTPKGLMSSSVSPHHSVQESLRMVAARLVAAIEELPAPAHRRAMARPRRYGKPGSRAAADP